VNPETMIRARIARGHMPPTIERLLEHRGTIEDAAMDLVKFTGTFTFADYVAALRRVYG